LFEHKQVFNQTINKMKRIFSTAVLLAASTLFVASCKKDSKSTSSSHKVQYKAFASSNASIYTIVYINAQGDATSKTGLNMQTWESEEINVDAKVPAVNIGANALVNTGTDGQLTVQILVDGKVVKENIGTGNVLTANTTYMF
jgi:uncharacterized alpha/beta hydrolase family protein